MFKEKIKYSFLIILFFETCFMIGQSNKFENMNSFSTMNDINKKRDLLNIEAGTSYFYVLNTYGQPDEICDIKTQNFFWFDYIIDENVIYHFWCGLSDKVLSFSIIEGNNEKIIFNEQIREANETTKEDDIYYLSFGILKSEVEKLFRKTDEYKSSDEFIIYNISNDCYLKLFFSEEGKLWKVSKIYSGKELQTRFDLRIKKNLAVFIFWL